MLFQNGTAAPYGALEPVKIGGEHFIGMFHTSDFPTLPLYLLPEPSPRPPYPPHYLLTLPYASASPPIAPEFPYLSTLRRNKRCREKPHLQSSGGGTKKNAELPKKVSERRVWKRKLNPVCFQGAAAAVAQASEDLWGAFKKRGESGEAPKNRDSTCYKETLGAHKRARAIRLLLHPLTCTSRGFLIATPRLHI